MIEVKQRIIQKDKFKINTHIYNSKKMLKSTGGTWKRFTDSDKERKNTDSESDQQSKDLILLLSNFWESFGLGLTI